MADPTADSPEPSEAEAPQVGGNGSLPLPPERDAEAAALVSAGGVHPLGIVADLRGDPTAMLFGLVRDDRLTAVFALRRDGLTMALPLLAGATAWDEWLALKDAVEFAGRWPVVVETNEAGSKTYRQAGFRMVSRRKAEDGTFRYRLGWHVPTRQHPR